MSNNAPPSLELIPSDRTGLSRLMERAPDPITAIEKTALWFARSGLFGCDRLEQGAIIVITCLTEGISPLAFSRTYDIISGKLRMKAAAAHAKFRERGGKVAWVKSGEDGQQASADFTWEGQTVRFQYTLGDAEKAQLIKKDSGWIKNPANMLRARVLSNGIGMLAPEIFAGEDEDGAVGPLGEPPALKLGPPAAAPTVAEPARMPPPMVAAASPPEPPDDIPMSYPPTQQQAQPVAPAAPAGRLSQELQDQLIALITPDRLPAATNYVRSLKWIGPCDLLDALSEKHARQILMRGETFIAKLGAVA